MPLQIVRENIVHMKTDAIVNAANSSLQAEGGVCGSIFDVAGCDAMQKACNRVAPCETGCAVMTDGFGLPARFVIHAVGPVWHGGNQNEEALLRACYRSSLALARQNHLESVAFPLLSSGACGYPKEEALSIAVSEIANFLMGHEMTVYIVVYDHMAFQLSTKLFPSVASYIDDQYVDERKLYMHLASRLLPQENSGRTAGISNSAHISPMQEMRLNDVVEQLDETFSEFLFRLIDRKGETDVAIYKKANIDRKHFSKIRSNKDYKPTKQTALAFAVALELSLEETKDLLARAGFALTHASKADIIIEYFLCEHCYDIYKINEALFTFEQPLLGA